MWMKNALCVLLLSEAGTKFKHDQKVSQKLEKNAGLKLKAMSISYARSRR